MKHGDVTPMFLPAGKFVTRWKEDQASVNSAIVAGSEEECKETLAAKFDQRPSVLRRIGLFQFLGWADEQELPPAVRGIRPRPLVSFAKVLTVEQIRERLHEIVDMVEKSQDGDDWYVEVFVRSRKASEGNDSDQRFRRHKSGNNRR